MARLILRCELFPQGRVVITEHDLPLTIGRSHRADIAITDGLLSRIHAEFRLSDSGKFEIADQGSTNLTIVNDRDVDCAELKSGDRILLGETEMTVEIEIETDPVEPTVNPLEKTTRELRLRHPPSPPQSDRWEGI